MLEAEYHLNRNWHLGRRYLCKMSFLRFLGIEHIDCGDELGWYWSDGIDWIDFNHHKTVLDDGLEVYVIDMAFRLVLTMTHSHKLQPLLWKGGNGL